MLLCHTSFWQTDPYSFPVLEAIGFLTVRIWRLVGFLVAWLLVGFVGIFVGGGFVCLVFCFGLGLLLFCVLCLFFFSESADCSMCCDILAAVQPCPQ